MSEPEDSKALRNAGDFFTHCRRRYGLAPEEALGLLAFVDAEAMKTGVEAGATFTSYDDALEFIEESLTLRSGRILRPATGQADLAEALDDAERKAWDGLKEFRFDEYAHWAEVWASLAKISGEPWKNPFGVVAALGRTHGKRGSG